MLLYGQSLNALDVVACALIFWAVAATSRRYFALKHVPGPLLASLTDFWFLWVMRYGDYRKKTLELDRRYGKLVRYGPSRVLFSDAEALPLVYGTTKPFTKAASYEPLSPYIRGRIVPSILSSRDETDLSAIKRQISHVFSNTAILDFEHHIDDGINQLTTALQVAGPKVNLQKWLSSFSFDTICRVGFSDETDMMSRSSQEVESTLRGGQQRFRHWNNWCAVPYLENLLFKNRIVAQFAKPELITSIAAKRVAERIEKGGAASSHQDLLDRYFQAQEKAPALFDTPKIIALTLTIVHAGSETTAHSLSILFYCLLTHPHVFARVKKEINEANLSFPPQYTDVAKLTYLEACIKESQRVLPLASGPVEREVPPSGTTISGTFIPGGTVVTLNKAAMAADTTIFDPHEQHSVHEYIPERWLGISSAQLARMDRANFAFSHGKRMCLGVHLAWCEQLKVIPAILMRFDVELQDPKFELEMTKGMVGLVTGKGLPVVLKQRA